jgi:hypothetical protein
MRGGICVRPKWRGAERAVLRLCINGGSLFIMFFLHREYGVCGRAALFNNAINGAGAPLTRKLYLHNPFAHCSRAVFQMNPNAEL